ncbi:MAG: hypothetical protein LH614_21475 [Pyrinomonadaceae bacterium]|nr:hypothetical protein [Pyrinomonadaceae bacterium]
MIKNKYISKVFALVCCSLIFTSAIAAQEKFSEYTATPVNLDALAKMASKFTDRLVAEPATTRGFINLYKNSAEATRIKSVLEKKSKLKNKVFFLEPGRRYMRETSTIEFWIVPSGADEPFTPTCVLCECPTLSVFRIEPAAYRNKNLMFAANASGGSGETITFTWKVSAGKIVEGQGTPIIEVDAEGAKEITATVEISGVCEDCARENSLTTKIQ